MQDIHWPDDRLCRLLGIEAPIIQAPMAGSSTVEMARAVNQAGGLGSLACATFDAASLDTLLCNVRSGDRALGGPLNANFFAHPPAPTDRVQESGWRERLAPYFARLGAQEVERLHAGPIQAFDTAHCAVVAERRPEVVSFHFGLPAPALVDEIKAAGSIVMSSATSVREARWLEERGCDVIIAQGSEAGGHRGMFLEQGVDSQLGTLALVPQVADAVAVPVVAAGGIADGRGIAAAFALGACGAQIGTAFLFTQEASITPLHLETLRGTESSYTAITNVFSGRPARCVTNRATSEIGPMAEDVATFPLGFSAIAPLRNAAEAKGSRDFSAHYCGQSAALHADATSSTAELMQFLIDDARLAFERFSRNG
jgi:nitronate monooxygenase